VTRVVEIRAQYGKKAWLASRERAAADNSVCSQTSLQAARTTLTGLGFDYLIDDSRTRLQASHVYAGRRWMWIRSVITIDLAFDASGMMKSCNVEATYINVAN
jgi:hypothetical protein